MTLANDDTLRDLMRRLLNDPAKKLDKHLVATQLGVSYRVLMHYFGNNPERRFPAELLPKFCEIVGDHGPLDFVEQEAGRMAFTLPPIDQSETEQVMGIGKLMKEASEAVAVLSKTIQDGVVDKREAEHTIAEIDDVIRHCAELRHWLQQGNRVGLPSVKAQSERS
jgi:hypothetical protein